MQILVDVRHLQDKQKTGVGEYTTELLRALFELDHENRYELFSSSLRATNLSFPRNDKAIFTHRVFPSKIDKLTTYFARHPRLDRLAATKSDLVWFPNINFTSLSPHIPYILTIHDLSWKIFPEFFSARMRLWHKMARPNELVANAAAIIVPSSATKEDVVRFFKKPDDQIHVIPHGVDPMFNPSFQTTDHGVRGKYKLPKRFALFVGTLEPRKNIVALINAIEAYRRQSGDDLHLVLVGGWGWKSAEIRKTLLRYCTTALPSPCWLHHLGYIPRTDLPALYRAATVFTWPSIYEGFGLPVLEAMASGCPVITSHTSSLPELTENATILINPFRSSEITQALEQLLSSTTLQNRLKMAGIDRAKQFSWNLAAKQTLTVFKNTVSR